MSGLLASVVDRLESAGVSYAVIGAYALAAHGVVRGTLDVDLAVAAPDRVLDEGLWRDLDGAEVEIRPGGPTDPLAGLVRVRAAGDLPIDVVVFGPLGWQREAIERAEATRVAGLELPVIRVADLIRLKLYAAGPRDGWDVEALLASHPEADAITAAVDSTIDDLPKRSRELWGRLRAS